MKKEELVKYIKEKLEENKKLSKETHIRLAEKIYLNREILFKADFSNENYRDLLIDIIEETELIHCIHSSSEALEILAYEFKLKIF